MGFHCISITMHGIALKSGEHSCNSVEIRWNCLEFCWNSVKMHGISLKSHAFSLSVFTEIVGFWQDSDRRPWILTGFWQQSEILQDFDRNPSIFTQFRQALVIFDRICTYPTFLCLDKGGKCFNCSRPASTMAGLWNCGQAISEVTIAVTVEKPVPQL